LREAGIPQLGRVRILGSGATAASVLAAVAEVGADDVAVSVRSLKTTAPLVQLAGRLGVHLRVEGFSSEPLSEPVDVVISTLPGGAGLVQEFSEDLRDNTPLVDIAYDPWPTALAEHWAKAGGRVQSGLSMLINQALAQVRVFTSGDPTEALSDEPAVLAAMRDAVGATTTPS
ncbi:MAG: shikimate dehydrogenase, partial [Terrimesophilobacter sp.]